MTSPSMHVDAELGALIDGTLPVDEIERVRTHLATCLACRRLHDDLLDAVADIRGLPTFQPPANVWAGIERELDAGSAAARVVVVRGAVAAIPLVTSHRRSSAWPRAAAAAAVVAVAALGSTAALGVYHSSWSIQRVAGSPVVNARPLDGDDALGEGEWLETDATSRARLSIGTLGSADVGPGSRVKLVQAGGAERALRIERGSIDARVWAPPRFFLVETPAATAIDLGCIYTLDVDERGNGVLVVRSGQVELRGHGRSAVVVAGTIAEMRTGSGPGTPYDSTETPAFREALAAIDFGAAGERHAALDRVLDAATVRSTITLWHLLPRVPPDDRGLVYDRLAAVAPPPAGVDRDGVMRLDQRTLGRWRTALEPKWSTERVRLWKRAWRALWSAGRDA